MPATTPILFPSGEDANPLNRRLPAEVVTRRRREVRKPEEKAADEVRVDLKTALLLKPEARLKWLTKACKMAEEGKASTTELHSIVSSRKFAAGVHPKIGRRMAEIVLENLGIFSDKQQKHLKSDEWVLTNTFGSIQDKAGDADGDDQERERDERSRSRDRSEEDDRKVRKFSEERREGRRSFREEPAVQPLRRESDRGRDGGGGVQEERSGRQAREPEPEGWVEAPAAGRHEDRARREALLAEERARRKAREREDQEKWMSVEAENAKRKALEQQQAKKKQLEEEADSSLLALEQMMGQVAQPPPEPERDRRRDRKASRSRSVRSASRPRRRRPGREGRDGSYSVSVKRDRSRGRRRRRPEGPRDRAAFDEALRRRMEEREAHDTTRIPVVDPGHAQRMLGLPPR